MADASPVWDKGQAQTDLPSQLLICIKFAQTVDVKYSILMGFKYQLIIELTSSP